MVLGCQNVENDLVDIKRITIQDDIYKKILILDHESCMQEMVVYILSLSRKF